MSNVDVGDRVYYVNGDGDIKGPKKVKYCEVDYDGFGFVVVKGRKGKQKTLGSEDVYLTKEKAEKVQREVNDMIMETKRERFEEIVAKMI